MSGQIKKYDYRREIMQSEQETNNRMRQRHPVLLAHLCE